MCKLTNIMQTEHLPAKEIKNVYVPNKASARSVFRTLLRQSMIAKIRNTKHKASLDNQQGLTKFILKYYQNSKLSQKAELMTECSNMISQGTSLVVHWLRRCVPNPGKTVVNPSSMLPKFFLFFVFCFFPSSCSEKPSHCNGFSCCRAWALE